MIGWLMDVEHLQLLVSGFTALLATSGATVAWRSFRRTEQWKEAEFLAREMKEFFGDARVGRTLQMIDWGLRRIQLFEPSATSDGKVMVDRALQARALRPHVLLVPGSDEAGRGRFTPEEAAIRDHYDAFLDGLERLGNFLKTDLIGVEMLRPYVGYWVDSIYSKRENPAESGWGAALLTYIHFYGFRGVQHLFSEFDKPIDPGQTAYLDSLAALQDQDLAAQLRSCVATASS